MPEEEVPTPHKGKKKWILVLIAVLVAAGLVLSFYPGRQPSAVSNQTGAEQKYTPREVESIVGNSYPVLKGIFLNNNSVMAGCLAATKGNINICDNLSEYNINDCYDYYNNYMLFSSNCDLINDSMKDKCNRVSFLLNDLSCDRFPDEEKPVCRFLVNKDVSMCLSDPQFGDKRGCEIFIFEFWAMKDNDKSHCNSISSLYGKEQCKAFVEGDCEEVINDISRDWARFSLARESNQFEICQGIKNKEIGNLCLDKAVSYDEAIRSF